CYTHLKSVQIVVQKQSSILIICTQLSNLPAALPPNFLSANFNQSARALGSMHLHSKLNQTRYANTKMTVLFDLFAHSEDEHRSIRAQMGHTHSNSMRPFCKLTCFHILDLFDNR